MGKTGEALNANMLLGGGSRIKLSHAIAATETELDFCEPKIVVQDGRCVVKDVDVTLTRPIDLSALEGAGRRVKDGASALERILAGTETARGKPRGDRQNWRSTVGGGFAGYPFFCR